MPDSIQQISEEIRRIYQSNPENPENAIEMFLEVQLKEISEQERLEKLHKISQCFHKSADVSVIEPEEIEEEVLARVFSLILGEKAEQKDLSSSELLERLARSLNTVFDNLNQLVDVINQNLYGEYREDETIRQVIGSHMTGDEYNKSLEDYLGQIKQSFFVALQGFRKASGITVDKILKELDPAKLDKEIVSSFKFGPLRKAEYFEIYQEKYEKVKKWYQSERFMEDLSREFEKACEKIFTR